MRIFRPRVPAATDLPDEIADHARDLAVALANPSTPHDERCLRRAFSKRLSTEVLLTRVAGGTNSIGSFGRATKLSRPVPIGDVVEVKGARSRSCCAAVGW